MSGAEEADRRHSIADTASVLTDPVLKAQREARNGLLQFDLGLRMIDDGIEKAESFRFRPSMVLALHRAALEGISEHAGQWRPAGVKISGSMHEPIGAHRVPEAVEEMCDYLNDRRADRSPVHLASYAMWRLNWIHPFSDGNGRTSRIFSYCVLCVASRLRFPGANTIPEQIVANRTPYFDALEAADQAEKLGGIDLSAMERLLEALLAKQLVSAHERATGQPPSR